MLIVIRVNPKRRGRKMQSGKNADGSGQNKKFWRKKTLFLKKYH